MGIRFCLKQRFERRAETDEFIEFHTDDESGVLIEARRREDFFEGCERDAKFFVHEEDQELFVKTMNREDNSYYEFSATALYDKNFDQAKEGTDFFTTVREAAHTFAHPGDLNWFLSLFTKENMMPVFPAYMSGQITKYIKTRAVESRKTERAVS